MSIEERMPDALSLPVAVIMERMGLANRWITEKWEAKGVVCDTAPRGTPERVIVQEEKLTQILFPGRIIKLNRDEAEGYYLNVTSPRPKVFILWRMSENVARPELLTVSYNEGTRWADSGENVDGVPLPVEFLPWICEFVEKHYIPKPREPKHYATNKDKGRMGRVE